MLILKNTHRGQDWYGNCEECGKKCDNHYKQWVPSKGGGHDIVKWGHLECLKKGIFEDAKIED